MRSTFGARLPSFFGGFLNRYRLLKGPNEPDGARHVIEDEKAFLSIQKHVVVGKTPVVPHVVERIEGRKPGSLRQDHLGHSGFDEL